MILHDTLLQLVVLAGREADTFQIRVIGHLLLAVVTNFSLSNVSSQHGRGVLIAHQPASGQVLLYLKSK